MNYQHAFHAGSFADVFKHVVLCILLDYLLNKDKPFTYLDTHAGQGRYHLKGNEAQKTKEYQTGILQLYDQKKPPTIVKRYLQIINQINPDHSLAYYPGSPLIARAFVRPGDRMILTELHPVAAKLLKEEFAKDAQVAVHLLDGYQGLKAFLPPLPRRGIVLIDPPYEKQDEWQTIIKQVKLAYQRWQQGIFVIWYPIKNRQQIRHFEQQLIKSGYKNVIMTELSLFPDDSPLALNGSGMAIINPPWQLKESLAETVPWIWRTLDKKRCGHYRIEQLTCLL